MIEIIPAVLSDDFKTMATRLAMLEGVSTWAHVDASDGLFAPYSSWQTPEDLNEIEGKIRIEAHLMIEQPEEYLKDWMMVADRLIVHYESTQKLDYIIKELEHLPIKLGIAFLLDTPLEKIDQYVGRVEVIQLMSIAEIGKQGIPFDERIFDRIKTLRQKYPDVTIAVDGGVSLQNAPELIATGANHLVVGSTIWGSKDPVKAIEKFKQLV